MRKTVHEIPLSYMYDKTHKGAPYSLNEGETWMNHGDLCECMAKAALGYAPIKDGNGSYDKTDDIPELRASVKSSSATVVNKKLGYDFESVKAHYMATVHSTLWIWASLTSEELTLYYMDAKEFCELMDNFAVYLKDRRVNRFRHESQIMRDWLEAHVTE